MRLKCGSNCGLTTAAVVGIPPLFHSNITVGGVPNTWNQISLDGNSDDRTMDVNSRLEFSAIDARPAHLGQMAVFVEIRSLLLHSITDSDIAEPLCYAKQ